MRDGRGWREVEEAVAPSPPKKNSKNKIKMRTLFAEKCVERDGFLREKGKSVAVLVRIWITLL